MSVRSASMMASWTVMLAMIFLPGSTQAAQNGWKCSYAVLPVTGPFFDDTGPYYDACYGQRLTEVRARAGTLPSSRFVHDRRMPPA